MGNLFTEFNKQNLEAEPSINENPQNHASTETPDELSGKVTEPAHAAHSSAGKLFSSSATETNPQALVSDEVVLAAGVPDTSNNFFNKGQKDGKDTNNNTDNLNDNSDNIVISSSASSPNPFANLNRRKIDTSKLTGEGKKSFKDIVESSDNNILEGIELPDPPNPNAEPEEVTQYLIDKLTAVASHTSHNREVLAQLHTQLKEQPQTSELLMPQHLGLITSVMEGLASKAHKSAKVKKTKAVAKEKTKTETVKKAEKLNDSIGSIF